MANKYPGAIPSFPTMTDGVSVVSAQDDNLPSREVEGARSVLGDNPYTFPAIIPIPHLIQLL